MILCLHGMLTCESCMCTVKELQVVGMHNI